MFKSSYIPREFGAFGEVLAENLTRCHAEICQKCRSVVFSVAFGEILGQNLTKCPRYINSCFKHCCYSIDINLHTRNIT